MTVCKKHKYYTCIICGPEEGGIRKYNCEKCRDTGIWDTGNNDLPCDCPAGGTALFNVAGVHGPVSGADMKRHLFNTSPEPLSNKQFDSARMAEEKIVLDRLQDEIGAWSERTFPHSTPETILRHFQNESKELQDATDAETDQEIADCIMLLFHLAHKRRTSARDAIREKFEICKKRKWGPPDEHGVVRHVEGT